jgi:hypothetical protein
MKYLNYLLNIIIKFIIAWLYLGIGLLISIIVEKYIYNDINKENSSDYKILYTSLFRFCFIILCLLFFLEIVNKSSIKGTIPLALVIIGIFMQISNLKLNVKYLIDKYILKIKV